jgi:protein-L-isoaspartate(D-aspartate) O-methyltransferase
MGGLMAQRPGFPIKLNTQAKAPPVKAPANKPASSNPQGLGLDSSAVRQRMVQKLALQGIDDEVVLEAMGRVERHRFVDSALVNQAYEDTSLPIGLGQTISKPNVVARMIALLRAAPGLAGLSGLGRVLEIGTGCGYQAAVLACVAREVYSIERLRGLHDKARENLRPLRLPNVHLIFGDGMLGYDKGAPYSAIIAAAGGEAIPQNWIEQLAMGGRIVAPIQDASGQQALVVIDKTAQGLKQVLLEPVLFVPLKSGIA